MSRPSAFEPIAIVGRGCVLPKAANPSELWDVVRHQRVCTGSPEAGSWRVRPENILSREPGRHVPDHIWSDVGGYVCDTRVSHSGDLDAVFRWTLQAAAQALASYQSATRPAFDPETNRATGLIMGNLSYPTQDFSRFAEKIYLEQLFGEQISQVLADAGHIDARNRFSSGLPAMWVARELGLKAGSFAIDAACASGLYAIKLACDRLQNREVDAMLAGAVNAADPLFIHMGFCALGAMSRTGQSRPFHKEADGLVPSEGAAFVLLKRFEDALRDEDNILGIIRGAGLSNDGRSGGFLSPSSAGQVRSLQQAYASTVSHPLLADLHPTDVSLIECHATGTPVGDATEIDTLQQIFGDRELVLGSLKANLGHLITTSGVAGVLKILSAFEHEELPATPNAHPLLDDLRHSSFCVPEKPQAWQGMHNRLIAGVSSFGFGGNNAHLVLEKWQGSQTGKTAPIPGKKSSKTIPNQTIPSSEPQAVPLAVIAAAVHTHKSRTLEDFWDLVTAKSNRDNDAASVATLSQNNPEVSFDISSLKFPPNDLKKSLGQQLLILEVTRAALATLDDTRLDPDCTGVYVGMGTDPETCRYGLKWRLSDIVGQAVANGSLESPNRMGLDEIKASLMDPIDAASVVGKMPNIPANRLNNQYDFRGPGFTISQEELSGNAALDLAINAITRGEIDTALIAAVDLSHETIHRRAFEEVTQTPTPGADAAVMLVVKSLEAARRDGDNIMAVVERSPNDRDKQNHFCSLAYEQSNNPLLRRVGHAHAAAGLLNIVMSIGFVTRGIRLAIPEKKRGALPHNALRDDASGFDTDPDFQPLLTHHGRREMHVVNRSFAGESSSFLVWRECSEEVSGAVMAGASSPKIGFFAAPDRKGLIEALQRNEPYTDSEVNPDWQRLALVASADSMETQRAKALQHLRDDRLFDGWNMGGLYYRQQAFSDMASTTGTGNVELAFVFTGAASAYPGMGRQLLMARPALVSKLASRMKNTHAAAAWVYDPVDNRADLPFHQLAGSSFLCQVHAEFSLNVLGLQPQACLGLSSGETNGMFALGVWQDMDGLFENIDASGLYTHALANQFDAIRQFWRLDDSENVHWDNWRILAPVDQVQRIVAALDRVYLTIVNTANDCVIGGDRTACRQVIDQLERNVTTSVTTSNAAPDTSTKSNTDRVGGSRIQCLPLGHDLAIHCPAVQPFEAVWRDLHTRPVRVPQNIRFYANYLDGVFAVSKASVADALTGQALRTIDFPKIVNKAWQDGIRIFVEHGPRNSLTGSIKEILGDRPHLAVALDQHGVNSHVQACRAAAELWCAGVNVNLRALQQPSQMPARDTESRPQTGKTISFRLRLPQLAPAPCFETGTSPENSERTTDTALYCPPQVHADSDSGRLMSAAPVLARISAPSPAPNMPSAGVSAGIAHAPLTPPATLREQEAIPKERHEHAATPDSACQAKASGRPVAAPAPASETHMISGLLLSAHRNLQEAHENYLVTQSASHATYTASMQRMQEVLFGGQTGYPRSSQTMGQASPLPETLPQKANTASLADKSTEDPTASRPELLAKVIALQQPRQSAGDKEEEPARPQTGDKAKAHLPRKASRFSGNLPGPKFSRKELEILAGGKISSVLGSLFAQQDGYEVQVRMPEPPLLLCDRVLGIEGEAGSMGAGTIWTETDVREDSWYLHNGRMPGGIFIESGQADLLLISWLGIDFHNRGERAYRLLGCELVFHGDLPAPGDTLQYEIKVDGHAKQGDVRLFFFHYDCFINGEKRISVRNGQAGFFSINELENSAGVLWTPEEAPYTPGIKIPPPPVLCRKSSFSRKEVIAYTGGDLIACFGQEFSWSATHTRTPRTAAGTFNFIGEVTELDQHGGPAGRGYLQAVSPVSPDDWFFEGHFKNDPCMPGTLMADACLQMMGFYMTATGRTLHRDGWRFQPVRDANYKFVCRGQVLPTSREMTYEIFVDEIVDGDMPMIFAHVLCTVDGRKAFLCERLGLQLVPDWPVKDMPQWQEVTNGGDDPRPLATIDGFALDAESLLNCAWGKPSTAFGPGFSRFDGVGRSPRLPGPPYHFMTRISELTGQMGAMKAGATVEALYDIPDNVWYFDKNGHPTMPNAILMEIALQPCGWLASYSLAPDASKGELLFRNLDGTATQTREIVPGDKTIATRVNLQSISKVGDLIILNFDLQCLVDGDVFLNLQTVFGFFPPEAMENQKGLAITEKEKDILTRPSDFLTDLRTHKGLFFDGSNARLPASKLLMLDEINGLWLHGGQHGRGAIRGVKYVDVTEWFFKAHFFQDPVQPGSLGVEAMLQLMQAWMLQTGKHKGMQNPRFEPIRIGEEMEWHYRGQVTPAREKITIDFEVIEEGTEAKGSYVFGEARLWVDGLKIYHAPRIGMRMVENTTASQKTNTTVTSDEPSPEEAPVEEAMIAPAKRHETNAVRQSKIVPWSLSVKDDPWIADHCPTYTLPALPMTCELEMMARAAMDFFPGMQLSGITKAEAKRWISFAQEKTEGYTKVEVVAPDQASARIFVTPEDGGEPVLAAQCLLAFAEILDRPDPASNDLNKSMPPLVRPENVENLYASGNLFHGPAFQLVQSMIRGSNGATGILRAVSSCGKSGKKELPGVPVGLLNPALLDAALHLIPHDNYHLWCHDVSPDMAAYPLRIENLHLYSRIPAKGLVKVEARFAGLQSRLFPRTNLVLMHTDKSGKDGDVIATFELLEILLPKGALGTADPLDRKAFLRDRQYIPGLALSDLGDNTTRLDKTTVAATDWLPGTLSRIYHHDPRNNHGESLTTRVCVTEHIARYTRLHPYFSAYDTTKDRCTNLPLNRLRIKVQEKADTVTVNSGAPDPLDWRGIRDFWITKSGGQHKFVHDLGAGLIRNHVRYFLLADPAAFARMQEQPALYIANHQTGVESFLLLSILLATARTDATAIAKKEHLQSWIGDIYQLAETSLHGKSGLGMLFLDRKDQAAMLASLQQYAADSADSGASLLVHAEGTRSHHGGDRVHKISSVMIDLAIRNDLPIVPLKLAGGLPLEDVKHKLEFPWQLGQQDYILGAPIACQTLRELPYARRGSYILSRLNHLGPVAEADVPLPTNRSVADQTLVDIVTGHRKSGISEVQAVLRTAIEILPDVCEETALAIGAFGDGDAESLNTLNPAEKTLIQRLLGLGDAVK